MTDTKFITPQGAVPIVGGTRFRTWAPEHEKVEAEILNEAGEILRTIPLTLDATGYFHAIDAETKPGTLYKYRIDGAGPFPDPASHFQPFGVHGPSEVIDSDIFQWTDRSWKPHRVRDLVVYELHVGTFTNEGTFRAAIEKFPHLREIGFTAIEIMPVADFSGTRNWGYDGVCLYAPSNAYGRPDDMRALVDAAHAHGISVILDVVYNHFGPEGNYLSCYSKHYFDEKKHTPWGAAIYFDGRDSGPVRCFFLSNALYWMELFHIDGFRFDATHAILDDSPRHILEEIATTVRERGNFSIAEDASNEARLILPSSEGGTGFDAVWADDFHHVVRVGQTGENEGYYKGYTGTTKELVETLKHGWFFRGQINPSNNKKRGTECRHLPPERFVHCISNHDQAGNRAMGERLNHEIPPAAYRAASALLCLTPYTPLFFMGQEWSASTPFQFFTDHHEELGALVTKGRRKEFKSFSAFADPEKREKIPDPQALSTFENSKLDWTEMDTVNHAPIKALYTRCLALRAHSSAFRPKHRDTWQVEVVGDGCGALSLRGEDSRWLVVFDLRGGHTVDLSAEWLATIREGGSWELELSTNDAEYGGQGSGFDESVQTASFEDPELVILKPRG